jgi:hypothetical protein
MAAPAASNRPRPPPKPRPHPIAGEPNGSRSTR